MALLSCCNLFAQTSKDASWILRGLSKFEMAKMKWPYFRGQWWIATKLFAFAILGLDQANVWNLWFPLKFVIYSTTRWVFLQNHFKYFKISTHFLWFFFRMRKNWRFDMILLRLKWFCYIEKLIEWQFSQKAYKKKL